MTGEAAVSGSSVAAAADDDGDDHDYGGGDVDGVRAEAADDVFTLGSFYCKSCSVRRAKSTSPA